MNILKQAERYHNGDFTVLPAKKSTQVVTEQENFGRTDVVSLGVPPGLTIEKAPNLKSDVENPPEQITVDDLFSSSSVVSALDRIERPLAEYPSPNNVDPPILVPPILDPSVISTPAVACPICGHGLRWLAANDNDYCTACDPPPTPALVLAKLVLAWWPWAPRWEVFWER